VNARANYTAVGFALLAFALAAIFSFGVTHAIILAVVGLALFILGQTRRRHSRRLRRHYQRLK
jgi:uncharacterized membrane protein HdeD (DUF308 family)